MKRIHTPIVGLLLCGTAISGQALAGDVALHGFIRSAYDISNSESKYLETIDDRGSFGDTLAGLNYSVKVNPKWSVAGQLFAKASEGELGLDWAFATFTPNDTTAIRFGRQKYPLGLVTETIDIGTTYPWTRPPQEMYRTELGGESPNLIIESFDGISAVFSGGDDWEYNVQPFFGENNYTFNAGNYIRQMAGIKLETSNDMATLQAGYVSSKLTITDESGTLKLDNQTKTSYNLGAKLEVDDFLAYVEYIDSKVSSDSDFDSTASYATLAYQTGAYLPSVTYAQLEGSGGDLDQTSFTLAVAYQYDVSTVFKAQWKRIEPDDPTTGGLVSALPAGDDTADIASFTMDLVF